MNQTPPSSLRDATAPSRGGFGKEVELSAMPRAPLRGGLSPQVTGGLSRKKLPGQTPPSLLRNATAPNRGGLGKEVELSAMPRAPLLGGLSPQATGGLDKGQANRLHGQVLTPRRGGACSASGPHRQWQQRPAERCKVHCPAQRPCQADPCVR